MASTTQRAVSLPRFHWGGIHRAFSERLGGLLPRRTTYLGFGGNAPRAPSRPRCFARVLLDLPLRCSVVECLCPPAASRFSRSKQRLHLAHRHYLQRLGSPRLCRSYGAQIAAFRSSCRRRWLRHGFRHCADRHASGPGWRHFRRPLPGGHRAFRRGNRFAHGLLRRSFAQRHAPNHVYAYRRSIFRRRCSVPDYLRRFCTGSCLDCHCAPSPSLVCFLPARYRVFG